MRIHYISHHSILEYDEVQLLLDLGHDVFANGAYLDPRGHITLPRPALVGATYHEDWAKLAATNPKTNLPNELIEPFDVIIVMHQPEAVEQNWEKFKGKRVIWRSIGQSVPHIERRLAPLREQGLEIVRYSPKEQNIESYAGEDALIRFYKDENVYQGWHGASNDVVNFSQSLKARRDFCHYDEIMDVIEHFDGKVYGSGNDDLGQYNGGQVPYEQQLEVMREARVMVYGGTWPAPYTLSFIEALMMGLPIVAVSKTIAHVGRFAPMDFYEVDELLAEASGIVCDTGEQMIARTQELLNDPIHAENISKAQRKVALEYFSKGKIAKQWEALLG